MGLFHLISLRILRALSELEFEYRRNNTDTRFRRKYLRALGVEFESPISIGVDFYLRDKGHLRVGRNCSFGSFTRIWNYADIEIGNDFLSAGGLTINCGGHDVETLQPTGGPIRIGDRVWAGLNVTILGGVVIGDDVVIGAGSVVTKSLPPMAVYGGVPAKKLRELDRSRCTTLWGGWGPIKMPASALAEPVALVESRLQAGDFSGALQEAKAKLEAHPSDVRLHLLRARAAVQLGQIEEFETALARALEIEPEYPPAHRLLGDLLLANGQPQVAIGHLGLVLRHAPDDIELRLKYASCLADCGQRAQAIAAFEDVLQRDPGNQTATEKLQPLRRTV
ncbi:acyltransferase [Opitutus sp. ER46]|uniref:acyltransferase n=1 Tax=Opitutus sp. ER46 TaxID=2161864 RepID=UPI000D31C2A8|nr:acyltransferase [Opitutus sp. ER46]PTX98412.1 hypothetical protein DB354_03850 [Opitutus sp. ER46]